MACASTYDIYQLKISFKKIKPPVWRRVLLPKDYTFEQLHFIIVTCMDWSDTHVHRFEYDKDTTICRPGDFGGCTFDRKFDEKNVKIAQVLEYEKDKVNYKYDSDYIYCLDVILEKIVPRIPTLEYPTCIGGRRARPPEDFPIEEDDNSEWEKEIFNFKDIDLKGSTINARKRKFEEQSKSENTNAANASSTEIYQLKINLERFKPPIWRRVLVPKDYTFQQLHFIIVACMNWSDNHLHEFEFIENIPVEGTNFSFKSWTIICDNANYCFDKRLDEKVFKLSDYFKSVKDTIKYRYDLGSSWDHNIMLERMLPRNSRLEYPTCVGGRRARPPEECPVEEDYENSDWETEEFSDKDLNLKENVGSTIAETRDWETKEFSYKDLNLKEIVESRIAEKQKFDDKLRNLRAKYPNDNI